VNARVGWRALAKIQALEGLGPLLSNCFIALRWDYDGRDGESSENPAFAPRVFAVDSAFDAFQRSCSALGAFPACTVEICCGRHLETQLFRVRHQRESFANSLELLRQQELGSGDILFLFCSPILVPTWYLAISWPCGQTGDSTLRETDSAILKRVTSFRSPLETRSA
jgi:hypothetical protein